MGKRFLAILAPSRSRTRVRDACSSRLSSCRRRDREGEGWGFGHRERAGAYSLPRALAWIWLGYAGFGPVVASLPGLRSLVRARGIARAAVCARARGIVARACCACRVSRVSASAGSCSSGAVSRAIVYARTRPAHTRELRPASPPQQGKETPRETRAPPREVPILSRANRDGCVTQHPVGVARAVVTQRGSAKGSGPTLAAAIANGPARLQSPGPRTREE
jgi:hypothetical protein